MTLKLNSFFKKTGLLWLCFLTAAAFLLICSKSSPLYPMNDWVDVNCFLTMGKGLLHGMIPYVDLYEQKGPVLYFVYALVALLSRDRMWGQFLLEIITTGLYLFYSMKIAGLYLGKSKARYLILLALAAVLTTSRSFFHGGSVELCCLFLFVYGLYAVLRACKEKRPLGTRETVVCGIFAGVLLWVKYTMLGFYIGLALFLLLWYLIVLKDPRELMKLIGRFLLGVGAVTGLVLVYFLAVGGLEELFTCYFYNNIVIYSKQEVTSFQDGLWKHLRLWISENGHCAVLLILSLLWIAFRGRRSELAAVGLSMAAMIGFTFIGRSYIYYYLIFHTFHVLAFVGAAELLKKLQPVKALGRLKGSVALGAWVLCLALSLAAAYKLSGNTYLMHYDREDLPQYRFAKIIRQTEDPQILNLGFLDGGFYHAADVLPNCYYFCTFNVNAPDMMDTHLEYINSGSGDYIITQTRINRLETYKEGRCNYQLVDTARFYMEGGYLNYYLYQRIS